MYGNCNADADVSTEIAMCERRCTIPGGGENEPVGAAQRNISNPTPNSATQDVITLKNGNEIQALVQEIGEIDVIYKKYENPNGPNYTMEKSEIFMIVYANGSKDVFNPLEQAKAPPQQRQQQQQQIAQQHVPVYKYTFGKTINPTGSKKSPFLAGFLSFLVPGVGQFYNGDTGAGFLYLGCNIVCSSIWMNAENEIVFYSGLSSALAVNILSIVHARVVAKRVNLARSSNWGSNISLKIEPSLWPTDHLAKQNFSSSAYGISLKLSF